MDRLYYISQGETTSKHLHNIKTACDTGCRLIQLRLKNVELTEHVKTARKAVKICEQFQAKLIINDSIEVALTADAHGVHLGKQDPSPILAREKMAHNKIIGGTANTFQDCLRLVNQGVDYIGLGPCNFTKTKKNLSPILSINGYQKIVKELKKNELSPLIYAIGGIERQDIKALKQTGVFGIAVSGLLTNKTRENLVKTLNHFNAIFASNSLNTP